MLRVAAYCRVSTDQLDQANSLENQQRYFRREIGRHPDWQLQALYADEGLSGTSTEKRTQFRRMIQAAREKRLDLILTKEVSRFARNTVDTLYYTRLLKSWGIGVIFLLDHINTLESDGELRLSIMATIAQEESRKTSQRVQWGQHRRMEQGVVFGGSLLGYDVKHGQISVNPSGARTVRLIFRLYLEERKGCAAIARELRQAGIPSSRGLVRWSAATVRKILKNEKYCGDLVQKKTFTPDYLSHKRQYNHGEREQVVLRDHHEAIVDRPVWQAVQEELRNRARRAGAQRGCGRSYPLSGKILCGQCGRSFVSRVKKASSGAPYRVWRCGKAAAEGCRIRQEDGRLCGCDVGTQLRQDTAMLLVRRAVQDSLSQDGPELCRQLTGLLQQVLARREQACASRRSACTLEADLLRRKKQLVLEGILSGTIGREDGMFLNERYDRQLQLLDTPDRDPEQAPAAPSWEDTAADLGQAMSQPGDGLCLDLLQSITVHKEGRAEVALKGLDRTWVFAL